MVSSTSHSLMVQERGPDRNRPGLTKELLSIDSRSATWNPPASSAVFYLFYPCNIALPQMAIPTSQTWVWTSSWRRVCRRGLLAWWIPWCHWHVSFDSSFWRWCRSRHQLGCSCGRHSPWRSRSGHYFRSGLWGKAGSDVCCERVFLDRRPCCSTW